jgi:hypothetical protein
LELALSLWYCFHSAALISHIQGTCFCFASRTLQVFNNCALVCGRC